MPNWVRRLRAALLFLRGHPHIAKLPEWTDQDAAALSRFLSVTPAGKRFRLILWHHVQSSAFNAIMPGDRQSWECGYASGARGICSLADSLLTIKEPEPEEKGKVIVGDKLPPEFEADMAAIEP